MSHQAELSGPACRPMQEQTQATKPSSHGPEVWFIWLTISAIRRKVRRIFLQSRATRSPIAYHERLVACRFIRLLHRAQRAGSPLRCSLRYCSLLALACLDIGDGVLKSSLKPQRLERCSWLV